MLKIISHRGLYDINSARCTGCVLELNYVLFLYNSGAADPGLKPSADFVDEKLYI